MLSEIVKAEQEKRLQWHNKQVAEHNAHGDKMRKAKAIIEELGEGLIKLSMKFEEPTQENLSRGYMPRINVDNIMGAVGISNATFNEQGEIENIYVCGLGLFALMGEKHTIESFFKKIAPYLRPIVK
jgi:uncharacterized coiled-coil protein SlyX